MNYYTAMEIDYVEQIAKVMKVVVKYNGCRIEYNPHDKNFYVFGKPHSTLDEAKITVDNAKKSLEKSIKQ